MIAKHIYACGKNDNFALGIDGAENIAKMTLVKSLSDKNIITMAAGSDFSLALSGITYN
jgi:alpha-tubulin suppressor-like RCC1 family protein